MTQTDPAQSTIQPDVNQDTTSLPRDRYNIPLEYVAACKGKSISDLDRCPIIVFVNGRSGGRAGSTMLKLFSKYLGSFQVFDITNNSPNKVLKQLWSSLETQNRDETAQYIKSNLRIIVAGGDGTITWVLGVIADLGLTPAPPVGILPLGTGNDLSIQLGWGNKFRDSSVHDKYIDATFAGYEHAVVQNIDFWNLTMTVPDESFYGDLPNPISRSASDRTRSYARFWNYFSFGLDAEASYNFHSLRENRPSLASSRCMNQVWYGAFTCGTGWFCGKGNPMDTFVSMRVKISPSSDWMEVTIPSSIRAIILLNVQTYGGGRDIWGVKNQKNLAKKNFKPPSCDDGLIEIIGFKNAWHTAMVMGEIHSPSIHGKRLAQCNTVELVLRIPGSVKDNKKYVHMQLDGEPWKQEVPTYSREDDERVVKICIQHGGTSAMLQNTCDMTTSNVPERT